MVRETFRMTLIWIVGGLVIVGILAVRLGFLPPPHATTLIRIRDGELRIRRGEMRPYAKGQVADVLREAAVSRCFIAVTPGNRVTFSRSIPSAVHQRLRNIILNQWA
jgi:hypothetical protein